MATAWHESLRNSARNSQYNGWGALKAAATAERSADEAVRRLQLAPMPLSDHYLIDRLAFSVTPIPQTLVRSLRPAFPVGLTVHSRIRPLLRYLQKPSNSLRPTARLRFNYRKIDTECLPRLCHRSNTSSLLNSPFPRCSQLPFPTLPYLQATIILRYQVSPTSLPVQAHLIQLLSKPPIHMMASSILTMLF